MVIIGDHTLARQAMRILVESHLGIAVVGDFSARRAVKRTVELLPDAVLIDVDRPSVDDQLETVREIRSAIPEVRIVVIGGEPSSPDLDRRVVEAGASGYLPSDTSDLDEILTIIRRAAELPALVLGERQRWHVDRDCAAKNLPSRDLLPHVWTDYWNPSPT